MENEMVLEYQDIGNKTAFKVAMGMRFKKMREYTGLSQKETGRLFGMNQSNIARIEKGIVFPNMTICEYFHTRYQIDINWLITGEGEMIATEPLPAPPSFDHGEFSEEMKDLLFHLNHIPTSRINILKYFMGYKLENKKNILKFLKENNITRG